MKRIVFAAAIVLPAIIGAASIATADNKNGVYSETAASTMISQAGKSDLDCTTQVWPRIDQNCLSHVADGGEIRSARLVRM